MISVNIPSVNPNSLKKCLKSLKDSIENEDVEVIINNATNNNEISNIVKEFEFTEIKMNTNIFKSRILMIEKSKGDLIVLLDETRRVNKEFVKSLFTFNHDIGFIKEEQIGTGFYAHLARLHDEALSDNNLDPVKKRYILPRVYKRDLLLTSIDHIKSKLSPKIIDNMKALDLEILYFESSKFSKDYGWVNNAILYHDVGDIFSEMKKMFKYGRSTKILKNTPYGIIGDPGGRIRSIDEIKAHPSILIYLAIRAFPFLLGYLT